MEPSGPVQACNGMAFTHHHILDYTNPVVNLTLSVSRALRFIVLSKKHYNSTFFYAIIQIRNIAENAALYYGQTIGLHKRL